MAMADTTLPLNTMLQAGILDRLSILIWQQTEDAQTGKNRPASIVDLLTGNAQETRNKILKGVEADGD